MDITKRMDPVKRRRTRGAVALEYILLAALVAIALIAVFIKFRNQMSKSADDIGKATDSAVTKAVENSKTETIK